LSIGFVRVGLPILALAAALIAVSCRPAPGADDGVIVIRFWNGFTGPGTKHLEDLVREFNRQNEGEIRVDMSIMMWGDYYVKVPLALKGRKPPDCGAIHVPQMVDFVENGLLVPLDEHLAEFDDQDFFPNAWDAGQFAGARYAVPLDLHPLVLYWNKDMFRSAGLDPERAPKDRPEFLEAAQRLTTGGVTGILIPPNWPTQMLFYSVVASNGGDLFTPDGRRSLGDSPATLEAARFIQGLIQPSGVSPRNVEVDSDSEAFRAGRAAMVINGIWMMPQYEETPGLDFGMAILPQLGTERHRAWAGSHQLAVFRHRFSDARRTAACVRFFRFMSDNSVEWARIGAIPVRKSFFEGGAMEAVPRVGALMEDVEALDFPLRSIEQELAVGQVLEGLFNSMRTGADVEAALREGTVRANKLLSQERD
jgi:multiple sugar transport system substrate-binding protein